MRLSPAEHLGGPLVLRSHRLWAVAATLTIAGQALFVLPSQGATHVVAPHTVKSKAIAMEAPSAFHPVAPSGGTDLYHCTLLNPKVTQNMMITKINFTPGNLTEDHHAVLYWVPPSEAKAANKMNVGNKGWTCFGGTGIGGQSIDQGGTAWLGGWAPGRSATSEPAGTGMPLPKGSLIVMQIHYNLLEGSFPDHSKVTLTVVPQKTADLIPLAISLYPSPMDLPCPSGQSGPLCSRSASLADIGQRFGQGAVNFDNLLEEVCHNGTPVPGDTASCTWGVTKAAYLWSITPHMHLLGTSMTVTLNQGQSSQKTLLSAPYDFHYQRSWDMPSPVYIKPGDTITTSCTFNPELRSELPYLSSLPPRYVLWADGSSDEMCLAITAVSETLPSGVTSSTVRATPQAPQWPAALQKAAAEAKVGFLPTSAYTVSALRKDGRNVSSRTAFTLPICD
jgi:hypothetical protein